MTDYEDYENNLAFKPIGDWSDKGEVPTTDRTQSSLELVDKIKELTEENAKLKELLKRVDEYLEWRIYDEYTYIDYRLWEDIRKAIGMKKLGEE